MIGKSKKDQLLLLNEMYGELRSQIKPIWGSFPWPVIRVQTAYLFHLLLSSANKEQTGKTSPITFAAYHFSLKRFFRLLKLTTKIFALSRQMKGTLRNKVLLTGYADHINISGGKNSYLHPCKEELDKLGIQNELLLFQMHGTLQNPGPLNELFNSCYAYQKERFALQNAMNDSQNKAAFANATLVADWLLSRNLTSGAQIANIVYTTQLDQQVRFAAFLQFLKITQPSGIWTYCYYDTTIMSMIRAANALGLPVTEYQHSAQYDDHFAYAKWNDIDFYKEYFPSRFWLWRKSDEARILSNFTGQHFQPQTIAGGNILLAQQKKAFKQLNGHQGRIHILVCLQGIWIPSFMENFIQHNNNYTWHFRLHPRYPQDKDRLQQLQVACGEKVETKEANQLSLYELFSRVAFNITAYSGTALEANAFGVKNIIFSEEGYAAFGEYIRNNSFAFVTSEEELSAALRNNGAEENAAHDPVLTDMDTITQHLKAFIS